MRNSEPAEIGDMSRLVTFAPDVVIQWSGDEAVLLKLADETAFALNATAARAAALIAAGGDEASIVETLTGEYGVSRDRVAADVASLMDTLVARGLADEEPGR